MTSRTRTLLLVFAAAFAAGIFAQNAIPIGVFHDDGQYLILARSMTEHGSYRFDNLPAAPPGLHYPPGYPAYLALVWLVAPGNIVMFKFANAFLLGIAALAVYAFARNAFGAGERTAALVGVCVTLSAPFLWLSSLLISELLFVCVLYATLASEARRRDEGTRWQLTIGAAAGFTALVRSLGDPVGPLIVATRLVQRRWRDAGLVAAPWMLLVLPWKLWLRANADGVPAALTGAYGEYGKWWRVAIDEHGFAFIRDTFLKNVSQLSVTFSVFGWPEVAVWQWFAAGLFALVALVGVVHARRTAALTAGYAVAYSGIVLLWPFEPDRFFWMLAPAVVAACAAGIGPVRTWLGHRPRPWNVAAVVVAATMAIGVVRMHVGVYRTQPWQVGLGQRGESGRAAARLVARLPPNASVATDFDEIVHLETGRVVVPARGLTAAEYVRPVSDSVAATHLALTIRTFNITHIAVADVPTLRAVEWLRAHGTPMVVVATDSAGAALFARTSGDSAKTGAPTIPPGAR